jgi:hypothetical protein
VPATPHSPDRRLTVGFIVALALVGGSSLVPLLRLGLPLSGATGTYAEDQLQYFAWVREAAHHVGIANRFDLARGARTFVHPAIALSGAAHAILGLPIPVAYLLWWPVGVLACVIGFHRYAARFLPSSGARAAALALALFTFSPLPMALAAAGPAARLVARAGDGIADEAWVAGSLWGYPLTTVTLALVPLVLLGLARCRTERNPRLLAATCAGALFASWMHPWQGLILCLVSGGAELVWIVRRGRVALPVLLVLGACALPGIYFETLVHLDPVWRDYALRNAQPDRTWLGVLLALGPLAAPAALAYRLPAPGWDDIALRCWPVAALLIYALLPVTYPAHAFDGITLPLAILAVRSAGSLGWRPAPVWVVAIALALTTPGWITSLRTVSAKAKSGEHGYFIRSDERRALASLEQDRRPGGVLAPVSPGGYVPFSTGREVYVGHDAWTPDFAQRSAGAEALFGGRLDSRSALTLVEASRARFLFADCRHRYDLGPTLAPVLRTVTRYGCATVYELSERPGMLEAAGAPDE